MAQVRMKDIAIALGISVATVSRVLGNKEDPYISEETKKSVREKALSMGYKKNLIAQKLTSGKTNLIEIQIPLSYIELNNKLFECSMNSSYQITFRDVEALIFYKKQYTEFLSDGIISNANGYILEDKYKGKNLVSIGHRCSEKFDHIFYDFYDGAKEACKYLLKTCKKVAYFIYDDTIIEYEDRVKAYLDAVREVGQEPYLVEFSSNYSVENMYTKMKKVLSENKTFDGVFCHVGGMVLILNRVCYDLGIKVPEELSFVGEIGGNFDMEMYVPKFSSININMGSVAEKAWEFLMKRLENPDMPIQSASFKYKFTPKETTK